MNILHIHVHEQVHTIFYIFVKPVPHVVVVIVVFPPLYIHFSSRVRYFLRPKIHICTNIHVAVLFIAQAASTTLPPKMAVSINQPTK